MADVLTAPLPPSMLRPSTEPRSMYNGQHYRPAPVQPYAFQNTPALRQDTRSNTASKAPNGPVSTHKATASTSTTSSDTSSQPSAKDDSSSDSRPASLLSFSSPLPDLSFSSFDVPAKPSPDRYRRPAQKRVDSVSSGGAPSTPTPQPNGLITPKAENPPQPAHTLQRQASMDDMSAAKSGQPELAKRYRRRSLNQLETQALVNPPSVQAGIDAVQRPSSGPSATSTPTSIRPIPSEGAGDVRALDIAGSSSRPLESASTQQPPAVTNVAATRVEQKMNVPPRGASDNTKRLAAPSPLSRQASDVENERPSSAVAPPKPKTYAQAAQGAMSPSPAAQHLAAVSDRDLNKGMKSRLRRAFSFSSAQELRRAAGENNQAAAIQAQQAREQQQQTVDQEMDAEQLEIARRQEEAGIGAGIYSGQGGFTGSTDNLSISSTASSASMMLRKMGRGAKKSARSIKGLFRPKSVIGVPAADGPVGSSAIAEPSIGQISMVTVEAERQNVNVNLHADERTGGATGFPKLERNSLDAAKTAAGQTESRGSADGSDSLSRRSVVGSDKDRAEVLAAVKKGILKRSNTNSPTGSPTVRPNDVGLGPVPQITESPVSTNPSTPRENGGVQGRSSSAPNVNGDYFGARLGMARTMPSTPNGSLRSISFSPKISFHDVWSSTEYDRRGEIATCNRLTPMLAQQIKEELNTFKMEMEVHEQSKPHTHFF